MITLEALVAAVRRLRDVQRASNRRRVFLSPVERDDTLAAEALVDGLIEQWREQRLEEGGPDE